ncbi:glycosyltransferase family 34 protein [[Candida] arabinofermentans NRRL YB-2248]|uniref:Glycosyltransferase family 34 protein n=1 Tax=[Candida] arabinofermentans NRRL YB-2248 TaxID=983967 RepID=A0A1E4SX37_9ASCO|nr:glycosyltransferase family 34 protein [[Candida] arabinofermentans NRRL YB-2248]
MHLGIPKKSDLKPRGRNRSILPLPASFRHTLRTYKPNKIIYIIIGLIIFINWLFNGYFTTFLLSSSSSSSSSSKRGFNHLTNQEALQTLQKNHGIYKNEIIVNTNYIFPPIEHAPLLRELTLDKLFKSKLNVDTQEKVYMYNEDEDLNDVNEIKDKSNKENPLDQARKAFKEHGHKVFRSSSSNKKSSPEVVLVTGVDFEQFELSHLTKIVQNRVDYAHANKYGLYVRWIQEFIPSLQEFNNDYKWAKLFIMRAAMHAFPNAKYFWYLDEDSLIMRNDIELISYILEPDSLDPIMLRDQPLIVPNGAIKTYKNVHAKDIKFVITQSKTGLNTDSFILQNEIYGKGLLEFWLDPLMRKYPTFVNSDEDALTHILQWHPVLLSKSTVVPGRTICSLHNSNTAGEDDDVLYYQDGDFVVNFKGCDVHRTCELVLDMYLKKMNPDE